MQERFRKHLATRGLVHPGARVLVGYSGGADSTCLLHLLVSLGVDVVAGHLHHGQRSEADHEQRLCEAFASELNVPFLAGKADIPRMSQELKIGYEEAGREARYSFFRQAAFGTQCDLIATAHTRTDLVETMLLNMARGTGLAGLVGIPERRDGIVRPLLAFSREEARSYCEERGLWFHDDPANVDINFARSRIRHRVLPELRAINPTADSALVRLSVLAGEEDTFLNGMAAAALEQSDVPLNGALQFLSNDVEIRFQRSSLGSLPPVLFRRAVRLAVEAMGSNLSYEQTLVISNGVTSEDRGSVTADGGEVVVEWTPVAIDVRRLNVVEPFRYPLTLPGETLSEDFGWKFTAMEGIGTTLVPVRNALAIEAAKAGIKGPLYFRSAQSGDTMQPLGFEGRRKLSDIMSEAKLTEAARKRLPIVCDLVGPIWAPGVCLDERVRPVLSEPAVHITFSAT